MPPPLLLDQRNQIAATSLLTEREPAKGSLTTIFSTSRCFRQITSGAVSACQNACLCVLSTHCPLVLNTSNHVKTQPVSKVSRRCRSVLVPSDNLLPGKWLICSTSICMWVSQLESYAQKFVASAFVLLSVRNSFGHPQPKIVNGCFIFTKQPTDFLVCLTALTACIGGGRIAECLEGATLKRQQRRRPTLILEAVADYRLWIWYAYFSVANPTTT